MTDREMDERLLELSGLADALCLPGHRVTADRVLERQEELRNGIRRLYRDRTGAYPGQAERQVVADRRPRRDPIRVWRA